MDTQEKQQRTRRLEEAVSEMEMLMGFYPVEEDAGIFYCLRRAKEACFRAVELSQEDEADENHETHPHPANRLAEYLERVYGDGK